MPLEVFTLESINSTVSKRSINAIYIIFLSLLNYIHHLLTTNHHAMTTALYYMLEGGETFREDLRDDDARNKSDSEESFKSYDSNNDNTESLAPLNNKLCRKRSLNVSHEPDTSPDDDLESHETFVTLRKEFNLKLSQEDSELEQAFQNDDQDNDSEYSRSSNEYSSLPETIIRKQSLSEASGELSGVHLRPISPHHLGYLLRSGEEELMLLDCRSFMKYNQNHIKGALNACCTNNTIKKRFVNNRIEVVDLVSGVENKELFKETVAKEGIMLVIYDEDTVDAHLSAAPNCLRLIASRLAVLGLNLRFLSGGMKEFVKSQAHNCSKPLACIENNKPLFSPTSPYVNAAIDTTIMTEILPFLYLGNEKDASDVSGLQRQGITHLLNVSATIPLYCQGTSIVTKRLPSSDNSRQNIKQFFQQAIVFIDEAKESGGRVLVHCQAGVSRSPTITMAYLMASFGWTSVEAFEFVKEKRAIVAPNINFMGQLLEFGAGCCEGEAKADE